MKLLNMKTIVSLGLVMTLTYPTVNAAGMPYTCRDEYVRPCSDENISEFVERARSVVSEEAGVSSQSLDSDTVDSSYLYQYVDESKGALYAYEYVNGEEHVSVYPLEQKVETKATAKAGIPDGIGGRQKIRANSNTYMSGTVRLPDAGKVRASGTPYIYTGFNFTDGSNRETESDIGLMWSSDNGHSGTEGWKPYVKVGGTIATDYDKYYVNGYSEVTFKNSFLPGKDVTFYMYSNYNRTGKVRYKTMGYARYANHVGSGSTTFLTSIVEYPQTVQKVNFFKVLACIAGSESATGSFTATVNNIKLNDKVPSSSDYYDQTTEYTKISRSGNNLTFTINR